MSRRPAALWLACLSLSAYLLVLLVALRPGFGDLRVYRAEGLAMRSGMDLYGPLVGVHGVNTYPPLAALIFVPSTYVPLWLLEVVSVVGSLALLVAVCRLSIRLVAGSSAATLTATCALASVAWWCEPFTTSMGYGQINILLLALVLWDFNLTPGSGWRGVGVGLAAAIKVTPGLLIVYLFLTGRVRAGVTASATVLAGAVLTAVFDRGDTWSFWTDKLFHLHRVGRLENSVNQSVRGWLVRGEHTRTGDTTEMMLVLVVLVAGMACAVLAHRRLGDRWGLPAAAVTGLLFSPISWSHHWVWCIPILTLLWYDARPLVLPTLTVFWSYAVWAVPHGHSIELHLTPLQVAGSGWYVLFGLGFLVLAAVRSSTEGAADFSVGHPWADLRSEGGNDNGSATPTPGARAGAGAGRGGSRRSRARAPDQALR